jgi:hypothetical protein
MNKKEEEDKKERNKKEGGMWDEGDDIKRERIEEKKIDVKEWGKTMNMRRRKRRIGEKKLKGGKRVDLKKGRMKIR